MKKEIRIALIQMSMSDNIEENIKKALENIKKASNIGADIVCLPELFATKYFPQSKSKNFFELAEQVPQGKISKLLSESAKKNKIIIIGGSIFEKDGKKFYNTSVAFDENGKFLGKYRKIHIPNDPGFYEKTYFSSGNLGFSTFQTKHCKIAAPICFDQWYPEAARIFALKGVEIIFYPTAIGLPDEYIEQEEGNWQEAWEAVQRGHAVANSVIIASVNRVGKENNTTFWGGSFIYNQFGKLLSRGSDKEEIVIAKCDVSLGKNIREGWGFFKNRRPDQYTDIGKGIKKG